MSGITTLSTTRALSMVKEWRDIFSIPNLIQEEFFPFLIGKEHYNMALVCKTTAATFKYYFRYEDLQALLKDVKITLSPRNKKLIEEIRSSPLYKEFSLRTLEDIVYFAVVDISKSSEDRALKMFNKILHSNCKTKISDRILNDALYNFIFFSEADKPKLVWSLLNVLDGTQLVYNREEDTYFARQLAKKDISSLVKKLEKTRQQPTTLGLLKQHV